jgi:hypothetical protein
MALESLACAIARLEARGFRHSLRARGGALRAADSKESFAPEDLEIDEIVRFEGESDPAEEVALYALRGPDGAPFGTYSSMYGPATPPEDVAVLHRLRRARSRRFGDAKEV